MSLDNSFRLLSFWLFNNIHNLLANDPPVFSGGLLAFGLSTAISVCSAQLNKVKIGNITKNSDSQKLKIIKNTTKISEK